MAEKTLASPSQDSRVAALREELDPGSEHGPRKIWAALKALGLEPEDLAPPSKDVPISPLVPKEKAKGIQQQRLQIWEGLRESRLEALREKLEVLNPTQVSRFEKCGDGIRPFRSEDLPAEKLENMGGMQEFRELLEKKTEHNRTQQAKKGAMLVQGFLVQKKRMEQCDLDQAALEKRLKEQKKEQDAYYAAKKVATAKANDVRAAGIEKAAHERLQFEKETEEKLDANLSRARATRAQTYSKLNVEEKMAAAKAKQAEARAQAEAKEAAMIRSIELRGEQLDERLAQRNMAEEDWKIRRRAASEAKFQNKQISIEAQQQLLVEKKLADHKKFEAQVSKNVSLRKELVKGVSKSAGDLRLKARDKQQQNWQRVQSQQRDDSSALEQRHLDADVRREELEKLQLKCGSDVHSFREVKHNTFGALHRQRLAELKKTRDAEVQEIVFKCGEFNKMQEVQWASVDQARVARQKSAKGALTFSDQAQEGFIKIKSEPDERKIHGVMTALGFKMPGLPDEDDDVPEEAAPAKASAG